MLRFVEPPNVIVDPCHYCLNLYGCETGLQRAEAVNCLDQPYACFQLRGGVPAAPIRRGDPLARA